MSVFVQMIPSKPTNILLPNLVLWCIIMSQSVVQRGWFSIFKVKVTARIHMIMPVSTSISQCVFTHMPTIMDLPYSFLKIMKINRAFQKSLSFMTTTNWAFQFFPKSHLSFCTGTYWSHIWCIAHVLKTKICRFALGSAVRMHKRHAAEEVSSKFSEENIRAAKLQAE